MFLFLNIKSNVPNDWEVVLEIKSKKILEIKMAYKRIL